MGGQKTELKTHTPLIPSYQSIGTSSPKVTIPAVFLIISTLVTGGILFHFKVNTIASFCLMGVGGFGIAACITKIAISSLVQHRNQHVTRISNQEKDPQTTLPAPQFTLLSKQQKEESPQSEAKFEKKMPPRSIEIPSSSLDKPTTSDEQSEEEELQESDSNDHQKNKDSPLFSDTYSQTLQSPATVALSLDRHVTSGKQSEEESLEKQNSEHDPHQEENPTLSSSPPPAPQSPATVAISSFSLESHTISEKHSEESKRASNSENDQPKKKSSSLSPSSSPTLKILPNDHERNSKLLQLYKRDPTFAKQFFSSNDFDPDIANLLLLSHEEFLSLSTQEIASFSPQKIAFVYERLLYLEKYDPALRNSQPLPSDSSSITLRTLRNMDMSSEKISEFYGPCLGMLSISQLKALFASKNWILSKEATAQLLPENAYTYYRLQKMAPIRITAHFKHLPEAIVRYIPTTCFSLSNFPWTDLFLLNINLILPTDDKKSRSYFKTTDTEFTQQVLTNMDMQRIIDLGPYLSIQHLFLFSEKLLIKQEFPWQHFISKEGVSSVLRRLSPQGLTDASIPWQILATHKKEICSLFDFDPSPSKLYKQPNNIFAQQTLKRLSTENKALIAPALSAKHLPLFLDDFLKDTDFPWMAFIHKEDIGEGLRLLSSTILAKAHLPWDILIQEQSDAIKSLFDINFSYEGRPNKFFIQHIFHRLDIEKIQRIAPALSAQHLPLFSHSSLRDENFPWMAFIHKEDVGKELRLLSPEVLAKVHLPWDALVQKPNVIESLLKLDSSQSIHHVEANNVFSKKFLQNLDIEKIQRIAPALSAQHLPLFSHSSLIDESFPWAAFIHKQDIGEGLRLLDTKLLVKAHLPWSILVTKPNLVESLIKDKKSTLLTQTIFGTLSIQDIQKLAPEALLAEHLKLFPENILKEKDFPWTIFIAKEGIGKQLRLLYQLLMESHIPWQQVAKIPNNEVLDFLPSKGGKVTQDTLRALQSNLNFFASHLTVAHLELLEDIPVDFPETEFPDSQGLEKLRKKFRT